MMRLNQWIAILIFSMCLTAAADNKQDYDLGHRNFYQVTKQISERYEDKVDFADLFEHSWKSLETILPVTNERLVAVVPVDAPSKELQAIYSQRIQTALELVSRQLPEGATPTVRDLWNRSINGLVIALEDPYSQYLPPVEHQELQRVLSGKPDESHQFYGVGIHVDWDTQSDLGVLVITPLQGSPAYENGIQPSDIITGVNGKPLSELEGAYADKLQEAIDLIKGEKDTPVNLTVKRKDAPELLEFTLKRAPINSEVHIMREMLDDEGEQSGIGYIRLSSFYQYSSKDVRDALLYLKTLGMEKLVFDMRYNPGGYLDQAVKIADIFLPKGELITYTYGRESPYKEFRDSITSLDGFSDIPMVILVNEASASASEVVTGALKDNHRAVVVGKKSFGKGSVQEVFPLDGDAGLRLTVAKYYTPSGKCIHNLGIEPDIHVDRITFEKAKEITEKDYDHVSRLERQFERDPQLKAAYEYLNGDKTIADLRSSTQEETSDEG
ncbi:MAG: S41 family peptidase [Candidatus Hinthialibacter antarcticus]|nr:S41 family peptidase [Candidatus Hinthialibacter antarcticus]